ncbi:MAG TPA: YbhB/YbcL family Raf kinase inhibitor-like protein [Vicinamibacterales bacterium]|nr:YbhB/YbcL family Raf kinase inhibitor-like protein [Vicinamibacterales bacterium]
MPLTITSAAFAEGQMIPRRYTCEGDDVSPPLAWTGAPPGTQSFALIMDDPDAPRGTFTHWLVYDIPRETTTFEAGMPPGKAGRMLRNDFGKSAYGGPCPPRGHGVHHYRFTLYALDVPVIRVYGDRRKDLDAAIASHVLESAVLTGWYERR